MSLRNALRAGSSLLGATEITPLLRPGQYFLPASQHNATGTSATLGVGNLRVVPWVVRRPVTLATIGAQITVAGEAGSKVRLVLYADDGTGRPGALVIDAGQLDGTVVGAAELAASVVLAPGVYWLGAVVQSVTTTQPTLVTVTNWVPPIPVPLGTSLGVMAGLAAVGSQQTGITGAAPATFAVAGGSGSAARLFVKVA